MESILMEIFRGCYEVNDGAVPSLEGYRKAQETCQKVWDEAEKVLGPEARERLWQAANDEYFYLQYVDFREGFRLGAALMRELLEE